MKNQTLSIEQMKHLKDLGVDISKASMVYHIYKDTIDEWIERDDIVSSHFKIDEKSKAITSLDIRSSDEHLYHDMNDCSNYSCCAIIPTFTLQDILELLPKLIVKNKSFLDIRPNIIYSDLCISYMDVNTNETILAFRSDNIIDAAYQMLCWVAENNYLNKEEQ